jgi:serine/threonine protein kinase
MTFPPLPPAIEEMFDVIRPLGQGGMGAVWLVRDRFLEREVALKVLLDEHTGFEMRERFLREARTSARLEHPHIIDVYRADETEGSVWFTMRYVEGETLGDRIRERGALPVADVARILREVAWGLAYAHARGIVHRDIKPDNILLDRASGRAVLSDFGIARDPSNQASGLTIDGHVLGSVHFMSPEQASGEELDGRSDLYAVGVVGYLALSGKLPFDGTPQSVLVSHVTRSVPSLDQAAPNLPRTIVDVIERCLSKSPDDRYASADALAGALDAAMRDAEQIAQRDADSSPGAILSSEDALVIWQRAAQLQAEAAHRMERNARLQSNNASSDTAGGPGNFRVAEVEAAAVEAGISRQYVALALAERRAGDRNANAVVLSESQDAQFTALLGTKDRAVSVSRVIPASPKVTLAAIGSVFTAEPYRLNVRDTVNGHPLDGGILRFTAPRFTAQSWITGVSSKKGNLLYRLEQIELFDLNVTLQPRGTPQHPACEVIVTGDLRSGLERNLRADKWIVGSSSVIAGAGGTAALLSTMGSLALAALPGVGLAAVAGGAALVWYRWLFRQALANAVVELEGLLEGVEKYLSRKELFGELDERGSTPRLGGGR